MEKEKLKKDILDSLIKERLKDYYKSFNIYSVVITVLFLWVVYMLSEEMLYLLVSLGIVMAIFFLGEMLFIKKMTAKNKYFLKKCEKIFAETLSEHYLLLTTTPELDDEFHKKQEELSQKISWLQEIISESRE